MCNFLQIYSNIEKELDRKLHADERQFLQWLYKRYLDEKFKKNA